MLFWSIRFIMEWVIWLALADKARWKEILPVCIFAGYISLVADQVCELLELWEYAPVDAFGDLVNATGMYLVVTYLFIQWLPGNKSLPSLAAYFFIWTSLVIIIEFFHLQHGKLIYDNWHLYYSYIADWILFGLLYKFYRVFRQQ